MRDVCWLISDGKPSVKAVVSCMCYVKTKGSLMINYQQEETPPDELSMRCGRNKISD